MLYRDFGRIQWKPSALGFGAMRLPTLDDGPAHVDEELAIRMIRWAIDHGVNYVDSAYRYHAGRSEVVVGKALREGYRAKVKVATKSPVWLVQTPEDADRLFEEQRGRLGVECVDFYLLHGLSAKRWPGVKKAKILEWSERARADGRIGHFGFSFHDGFDTFKEIIDFYDGWEFCQIQYNYMDVEAQAGMKGLRYAAGKGLGVAIMEPIRGGALADPPPQARKHLQAARPGWSPAEWALQWVWDQPEVSLVLSGMSTMEQVRQNVAFAGRSGPGTLGPSDQAALGRAREALLGMGWIKCTNCGYCQPCPNNVEIPTVFRIYNDAIQSELGLARRRKWYAEVMSPDGRADLCLECGECEDKCPQHLPIPESLKKAHDLLAPGGKIGG